MVEKPRPSRPKHTPKSSGAPAKPASPPPVIVIRRKGKAAVVSPSEAKTAPSPPKSPEAPAGPPTPTPAPAPGAQSKAAVATSSEAQAVPSPPQLSKRKERALALMRLLMERWPAAFPEDPSVIKPLAIGIHREVAQRLPEYSPGWIRKAITLWLNPRKEAYLRALAAGGSRYDLEGKPKGEVSPEHREWAAKEWEVREEQQKARREARKLAGDN